MIQIDGRPGVIATQNNWCGIGLGGQPVRCQISHPAAEGGWVTFAGRPSYSLPTGGRGRSIWKGELARGRDDWR